MTCVLLYREVDPDDEINTPNWILDTVKIADKDVYNDKIAPGILNGENDKTLNVRHRGMLYAVCQ